jgi:hypothetical protein
VEKIRKDIFDFAKDYQDKKPMNLLVVGDSGINLNFKP